MTLQRGARLGPYEVLELTGTGGMGEVYKARDTRIHRTVALKTLNAVPDDEAGARGRLMREARAVGALNHPHICALHDVGEWEGRDFLVMEFLEGETLGHRLGRGRLPLDEVLQIGAQIASALAAAHRAGVVHRDLKPANVMLTRGGVKLLDFGIAGYRAPDGATPGVTTASVGGVEPELAGTLPYMAPEQLEGRTVDRRADIFALGAVLFEMATGRRAFQGTSPAAVIAAILADTRPRASSGDASVPRALDRLISACVARDPDERPQDAGDVVRELTWIRQDLTAPDAQVKAHALRSRWGVHAAWAAMLIAVAVLSWTAANRRASDLPPPNRAPVVVLMDSPLEGRVYDPRTAAAGGTNADDVSDALGGLGLVVHKENTSPLWHREEQVVAQNPDLVVAHLSCLYDARVGAGDKNVGDHLFTQAENRLLLVFAYAAARNPRTRFIVYSRSRFREAGGEEVWVSQQEARLPVFKGRLRAFTVPGGEERATFRDAETARLLKARVVDLLQLNAR